MFWPFPAGGVDKSEVRKPLSFDALVSAQVWARALTFSETTGLAGKSRVCGSGHLPTTGRAKSGGGRRG